MPPKAGDQPEVPKYTASVMRGPQASRISSAHMAAAEGPMPALACAHAVCMSLVCDFGVCVCVRAHVCACVRACVRVYTTHHSWPR